MNLETIVLLLQCYGYLTPGFLGVCVMLGLLFASDRWNFSPRRLAALQAQRSKMEEELRELRQKRDWSIQVPSAGQGAGDLIVEEADLAPPAGAAAVIVDSSSGDNVDHRSIVETCFQGEPVEVDPDFGILYTSLPRVIDPVRMIRGVGPRAERSLNRKGVFSFKQIAHWSAGNVRAFADALPEPHIDIKRDKWIHQARELWKMVAGSSDAEDEVDHESKILAEFSGEAVRVDANFGIVYTGQPAVADPLHEIEGISDAMETTLQRLGILRYPQISGWSRHNLIQVATLLGIPGERIVEERWLPQARLLEWERQTAGPEWGISKPTLSDYFAKMKRDYPGEPVSADINLGIRYKSQPSATDDLTRIRNIDADLAQALNSLGVWTFRQIAGWADGNVKAFARRLDLTRDLIHGEAWIPQAVKLAADLQRRAAFAGESFRTDPRLGIVYYLEPSNADELTRVRGITIELAAALNREGIFTFKQIALWEPENIEAFAVKSGIQVGEIRYQGWSHQAQELHARKYGVEL